MPEAAPPRPSDRWRRLRDRAAARLLAGLALLFGALPRSAVQRLGRGLGRLAWWLGGRDRQRTLRHLALAYPELAPAEHRRLARASFLHHGTTLAELLHLLRADCTTVGAWTEVEGWERVERLRDEGRPVLILTGHCGNWELLAALINCRGLAMAVVARRLDAPEAQELLLRLRRRFGTETIERGEAGAARRLLKVFREGGALGMLIDQDTEVDGAWVPFFGRDAYTPVGAAKIALKLDAAVVPTFIERLPDGRHRATFHPPLRLPDHPEDATALMTRAIESQVRHAPEQWVWMHRRWRRRPPEE